MLKAKLKKPKRLYRGDTLYEQGQEVEVDIATARVLMQDPRFEIIGLDDLLAGKVEEASAKAEVEQEAPKAESKRPESKEELYQAIRAAADQLDPDDEDAYTATGKPQVAALEKILGYDITAEERDNALNIKAKPVLDEAESQTKKGGVVIKRVKKEEPVEVKEPAQNDPTTKGAVEV